MTLQPVSSTDSKYVYTINGPVTLGDTSQDTIIKGRIYINNPDESIVAQSRLLAISESYNQLMIIPTGSSSQVLQQSSTGIGWTTLTIPLLRDAYFSAYMTGDVNLTTTVPGVRMPFSTTGTSYSSTGAWLLSPTGAITIPQNGHYDIRYSLMAHNTTGAGAINVTSAVYVNSTLIRGLGCNASINTNTMIIAISRGILSLNTNDIIEVRCAASNVSMIIDNFSIFASDGTSGQICITKLN